MADRKKKKVAAICGILLQCAYEMDKKKRNREIWTKEWVLNRPQYGAYNSLMRELSISDARGFHNFIRMNAQTFEQLLTVVAPHIQRKDTVMRQAIPPAERLSLTLRYLATGNIVLNHEHVINFNFYLSM